MPKLLIIDDEPMVCLMLTDAFEHDFAAKVACANSGASGAQMISNTVYDLAIIDVVLPQASGFDLALLAANQNIPVLLNSGHPAKTPLLKEFEFPHLEKPFSINSLLFETRQILQDAAKNIRQVKASSARMIASAEALKATMAESRKLLEEMKAR